jgi:hypothetical protein
MGKLIGFNPELKSYQILADDGRIINSKSVDFLDFIPSTSNPSELNELIIEQQSKKPIVQPVKVPEDKEEEGEDINITQEEEDELEGTRNQSDSSDSEDNSFVDAEDVIRTLTPAPEPAVGRILRDQTLQVRPVKYSHFSKDPKTFKKSVSCPNKDKWKQAIDSELDNIKEHQVWVDQMDQPKKVLYSTWVFRTKPATSSSPEKQKARLCIQGFLQTFGKDFFETFAPTGKFPSLLTLLVLGIDLQLPIKQFDVKSAFLFAPLEEEIYIKTPEGSSRKAPYLKLEKSLYGLKQAPKNWFKTLTSWFEEISYNPSVSDACLFIHSKKNSFIFFHVDDLIVVGQTDRFEKSFLARFPNSTAHSPDTLLGMNLNFSSDSVELSQPALISKGLEMLGLSDCPPVKTPLTPASQLHSATDEDHEAFLALGVNYRSYTGMLNYLACPTRPDLAAAVSILSHFN